MLDAKQQIQALGSTPDWCAVCAGPAASVPLTSWAYGFGRLAGLFSYRLEANEDLGIRGHGSSYTRWLESDSQQREICVFANVITDDEFPADP